jgi:hypothetical protein
MRNISGDPQVDYAPIDFEVADNDIHSMNVKLTAGTLATIQTRAIGAKDHCAATKTRGIRRSPNWRTRCRRSP